jgi:peptide deformylase
MGLIMALLPILQFPDPRLKLVAKPVEQFDAKLATLCADMFETMYETGGVGLAAIQVNVQQRILVIDVSDDKTQPVCLINPKLVNAEGEILWEEGCLSFPGVFAKITRSAIITVEYFNEKGAVQTLHAEELTAVCIQHEIDHLNGITFYDHLSPLKQKMLRKKLDKVRDKTL